MECGCSLFYPGLFPAVGGEAGSILTVSCSVDWPCVTAEYLEWSSECV